MNSFSGEDLSRADDRWRELFPLPFCPASPRQAGLSVSARRRRAAVRDRVETVNSVIKTLNDMYSPGREGKFLTDLMPTKAQEACQHELFRAVAKTRPLSKSLTMPEAVRELLHSDLSCSGMQHRCGNMAVDLHDVG